MKTYSPEEQQLFDTIDAAINNYSQSCSSTADALRYKFEDIKKELFFSIEEKQQLESEWNKAFEGKKTD